MSTRGQNVGDSKTRFQETAYPPAFSPAAPLDSPASQRTFTGLSSPSTPGTATPSLRDDQEVIFALPPVDSGYAWIFLTAAFFVGESIGSKLSSTFATYVNALTSVQRCSPLDTHSPSVFSRNTGDLYSFPVPKMP